MAAITLLAVLFGISGEETVRLSGNVRARLEMVDNQARAGFQQHETLFNLRSTLTASFGKGPVQFGAELVDSRVYDPGPASAVSTNEVNAIELVQAWVAADLDDLFGSGTRTRLQAGRFLLDIGSRRLVANEDYRNTTNGFTGVRADLTGPRGWSATIFYTLPQYRLPDDLPSVRRNKVAFDRETFDLRLAGALLSKAGLFGSANGDIGIYRLDERDRPDLATRNRHLTTLSARLIRPRAAGAFDWEVEGIRQTGRVRTGLGVAAPQQRVTAWFAHASLGYTFALPWKPHVAIEYDHASGDRVGKGYGRFDTLFGMRRPDLGPAGLYSGIGRTNIVTPAVRVEITPSKRLDAFVAWRGLWLASRSDAFSTTGVRDPTGKSGTHAGSEFDARLRWWAIPERLRLEANGTLLAKGRFLRTAPNANPGGDTRYLSLNASIFF